jgi:hypothetical protein
MQGMFGNFEESPAAETAPVPNNNYGKSMQGMFGNFEEAPASNNSVSATPVESTFSKTNRNNRQTRKIQLLKTQGNTLRQQRQQNKSKTNNVVGFINTDQENLETGKFAYTSPSLSQTESPLRPYNTRGVWNAPSTQINRINTTPEYGEETIVKGPANIERERKANDERRAAEAANAERRASEAAQSANAERRAAEAAEAANAERRASEAAQAANAELRAAEAAQAANAELRAAEAAQAANAERRAAQAAEAANAERRAAEAANAERRAAEAAQASNTERRAKKLKSLEVLRRLKDKTKVRDKYYIKPYLYGYSRYQEMKKKLAEITEDLELSKFLEDSKDTTELINAITGIQRMFERDIAAYEDTERIKRQGNKIYGAFGGRKTQKRRRKNSRYTYRR